MISRLPINWATAWLDSSEEGFFSFLIRLKWWVGLLLPDIGKPFATRQE